jgi:hypothetical protein
MAEPRVEVRGAAELVLKLDDIAVALVRNSKLMGVIGARVNSMIKARTSEGRGADGGPFAPYSDRYAAWRKSHGYPIGHVDLTLTGFMMAAMTYTARQDRVTSFFMDTVDKRNPKVRNPQKAFFNQQSRDFFSLGADEVKEVERMVKAYIQSHLKDDSRGTE